MPRAWLQSLKLDQLHRLASRTGSYCSGNKQTRIGAIELAVQNAVALDTQNKGPLRIVSIDMGIRNLAYCTFEAQPPRASSSIPDIIKLGAWKRVDVGRVGGSDRKQPTVPSSTKEAVKESFEPGEYAKHAYSLIKGIVDEHRPTHVLIERQRFRSGGGAAVQEWTIRVGVFEAMLYATLRTLKEQDYCTCSVDPVAPAMVNRFWIPAEEEAEAEAEQDGIGHPGNAKRRKSTDIKQRKIRLLRRQILHDDVADGAQLLFSDEARRVKEDFLAPGRTDRRHPKLDDLADSLLQGLAWISWQRNRLNLESVAQSEFGHDCQW